jgi:hypothetical protein
MAVSGTIARNDDGTVRFTAARPCMGCGVVVAVDRLDADAVADWQAGMFAQAAFPGMSAGEREALVSGTHAKCYAEMFAEDVADDVDDDACAYCTDEAEGQCVDCGRPVCSGDGACEDDGWHCRVTC